jgi:putative transposase
MDAEIKRGTLGRIENAETHLNKVGKIVRECWLDVPLHYTNANLHMFVIIPNHAHGLRAALARLEFGRVLSPHWVRSFKAAVAKRVRIALHVGRDGGQRNYFDRLLRDGRESSNATRYIVEIPIQWQRHRETPEAAKS